MRVVLGEIDRHLPRLTSARGYLRRQLAAASLARGRALFDGLDAVQRADRAVVGGLLVRAIWECWVVGLYVLLRGDEGYKHLAGAADRSNDLISARWPADGVPELTPLGYPKQTLNYQNLATEVRALLEARQAPIATLSYDGLYRSWSYLSAHATHGSLILFIDAAGTLLRLGPGRMPSPPEADLRISATMLAHLAYFVLREFSIDDTRLLNAIDELHQRRDADDEESD